MPIKRPIIIPALLALSTAGSVLAGTAVATAATPATAAAVATSSAMRPAYVYNA